MTTDFGIGTYVTHKTKFLNGGMPMTVTEIYEMQAKCSYVIGFDKPEKEEWFTFVELVIVKYG